ncbi:hypothetical protein [Turicibacter sanguinis]|uniref:hypothetical protein n=1 Tax=Turicibacter sanguinis TaxID=154288 RepID=UPI0018A9A694|nr:hypothetical protein [Turicibacter sanguinis]MDB8558246.1 hypothetical protein [Turicibacter sanguinis]MDB8561022.1 hypothetical protein [Turicibacter sanguinis]
MKKWETPQLKNIGISSTKDDFEMYGNGGGNGNGERPGNLNHPCPDCKCCFQSTKDLADHRNAHPNNPLGGSCPGAVEGATCGPEISFS